MTLQAENGAPSFYTFATFRPGRIALVYGGVLTIISFCVVVFLFNYGIREKLWSVDGISYGSISPSPAVAFDNKPQPAQAKRATIARVSLSDSTIHSLIGSYYSATANRRYTIAHEGDQLSLQIDDQEKIRLIPVADQRLYADQTLTIEFKAVSGVKTGQLDIVHQLDIDDHGIHIIAVRQ